MSADAEDRLPDPEVIGQVKCVLRILSLTCLTDLCTEFNAGSLFIFAGQDTTSHALSRILDLLAHHPEEQARLRDEIREARRANDGNEFDYDTLNNLPYLDAICRETLRL